MKQKTRFRPQIGTGLISCAVVGIMTILFVAARGTDPARYNATAETLRRIKELDAGVNADAFELRFGLQNSCDALNDKLTALAQFRAQLRGGLNTLEGNLPPEMRTALEAEERQGVLKSDLAEQFKTSNAVLANSRYYFPAVCAFVRGHHAGSAAWPDLASDLASL